MKTVPAPNPHGIQLYDIVAFDRVEDVDGVWWIEADTTCGHSIATMMFADSFSVHISKGGHTVRHYSGGSGSDAERVFRDFYEEYLTAVVEDRKLPSTR